MIEMLGWIIIAILCAFAILCVTRCSPILFGIIMGVAVAYIGGYSLLVLMTFLLGLLAWWLLNVLFNTDKRAHDNTKIIGMVKSKIILLIGTASILANCFAWPLEIGFIASIIICKSILPTYMDYMSWYNAQLLAGAIFFILLLNTAFMYVLILVCRTRNHHST